MRARARGAGKSYIPVPDFGSGGGATPSQSRRGSMSQQAEVRRNAAFWADSTARLSIRATRHGTRPTNSLRSGAHRHWGYGRVLRVHGTRPTNSLRSGAHRHWGYGRVLRVHGLEPALTRLTGTGTSGAACPAARRRVRRGEPLQGEVKSEGSEEEAGGVVRHRFTKLSIDKATRQVHAHAHTHTHAHAHARTHTHAHARTHSHAHALARTHTHAHAHSHAHALARARTAPMGSQCVRFRIR
jgi:hypothetical protein